MKKALVLGGVSYDTIIHMDKFPEPQPQTIHYTRSYEAVGSTGAGKSIALRKLGMDVTLQGVIGQDVYGEKIKTFCEKEKIRFLYDIDTKGTERHVNIMNEYGERISIFVVATSDDPGVDIYEMEGLIQESDYVILNIINYCRHYIPLIKKHNKEIWCDLHDYDGKNPYHQDFIDAADYIFMSSDNLSDYQSVMETFIEQGKEFVVCTHGKKGATALTSDHRWIHMPIISDYKKLDTNGAGDNFFSGFLYGYQRGFDIEKCLKLGTIVGGLCVTSCELVSEELKEERVLADYRKYY